MEVTINKLILQERPQPTNKTPVANYRKQNSFKQDGAPTSNLDKTTPHCDH